ncbi:MAG: prepilin peptidase [Candidatus Brockarchaeota archaeon]|nr:prepilin peptidase [Candidatus Brockarchaeota archaeon]
MLNHITLYSARGVVSIFLLSISSFQDVKKREIDDRVWIAFIIAALLINLAGVLTGIVEPMSWLVFAGLQSALFTLLYYAGAFGGADAKSLICLSIMYPTCLTEILTELSIGRLTVPLSAFDNAIILTLVFPVFNLLWNFSMRLRGVELFKGLEKEGLHRRIAALFLLTKISFSYYRSNSFRYALAEKYSRSGVKRIVFTKTLGEDSGSRLRDEEYVFTNFLIPLQVFILLGLVIRLLYGDILLLLTLVIVRLLIKSF